MRSLTALAVAAACLLAPTSAGAAVQPTEARAAAAPAREHVVQLVTGDVVHVHGDVVQVSPASHEGVAGRLAVQRAGDTVRVVPESARPYLGRFLDPALFDVTRPRDEQGRISVRLQAADGAAVPGVTRTSPTTGYLTAQSAEAFGAALARQWERDERDGFPERAELFPGVQQVQADAPTQPAPVEAAAERLTLRLQALDTGGERVRYASVALINVDDARRYTGFPDVQPGSGEVRVPAGRYSAIGTVDEHDRATGRSRTSHVLVEDFVLSRDGQVMRFDARRATSPITVTTPRPAQVDGQLTSWTRTDAAGRRSIGSSWSGSWGDTFVSPTGPAARGALSWSTSWSMSSAPGPGVPYTYDLAWGADRVRADQSHVVGHDDVATVRTSYYADPRSLLFGRTAVLPHQRYIVLVLGPLGGAAVRDEHVLASPGIRWFAALAPDGDEPMVMADALRAYEPGQRSSTTWLRPAFFTGVARPAGEGERYCHACRSGDLLSLHLAPFRDAEPTHGAYLFDERRRTSRLRLWRDGVQVADVGGTRADVEVAPGPATYRLLTEVDRRAFGVRLATVLRTQTTFRSVRGGGTGLSDRWACVGGERCRALPLLQVRAPLPTALDGSLPTGTTVAPVVADHAPGSRDVPVVDVDVQTRTGAGPWVDVPVRSQGGGRFAAVLQHPRSQAGQLVDLRIRAEDALGGTVRATTTDAYAVAG